MTNKHQHVKNFEQVFFVVKETPPFYYIFRMFSGTLWDFVVGWCWAMAVMYVTITLCWVVGALIAKIAGGVLWGIKALLM